jgi:hypothetical protein
VVRIMSFFGVELGPPILLKQIKDKETLQSLSAVFRDVLQAWPQIRVCSCFETQETKLLGTVRALQLILEYNMFAKDE